ncbi:UNVERIFIED_CONTAM: ERAD-associated E3 ubiquitin-protein ligase HRD1B [Sesamum angustifolium]|uniref:RING-type E3 ubiquitin transferase n=1 Tax=Sesamum angustifolium TaxID=2727405 RepID=A0AAW2Q800_9LAMI
MNDRFPDATPEELNASDATCIICREEMTVAKKLSCGHLFHVHCLRSWLERQNTCPTCRALVISPENGISTTASRTHGHQQGTGTAGTSSQGSTVDGAANNNVSQHQARLQAAASAASLYEKSFVYPSPNALMWSPGYTSLPKTFGHPASTSMANNVGGAESGLSQQYEFTNVTFAQLPQCAPLPSQFPCLNGQFDPESASDSQLGLQTKLIKNQIEWLMSMLIRTSPILSTQFLQNQYQLLQTQNGEKTMDLGSSDIKGKSVSSPSSSVMDSAEI